MVVKTTPETTEAVFDLRPLEVGGFKLTGRAAHPTGRPTKRGWVQAMQVAVGAHESSPYWVGDLMAYVETRADWREHADQMVSLTGYALQTLKNLTYIARHVAEPERILAPSISHAGVVAMLPRPEQTELLAQARTEGLTVHEFRKVVRSTSRRKVIEGQAVLSGRYRVIYADCPWTYGTIEELCALPVPAHSREDAVLFAWVTSPLLYQEPGPREVFKAWGFTYKTSLVWDKVVHNFGNYVSVRHELLLICTRGSCLPDRPVPMPDSVQTVRREGEHSEKPEDFRRLIESLYDGPYLELFGRKRVEGWDVFGNDAALWREEVAG